MKSNPRIRLGTGALPKVGMSQAKREDGITYFVERDNGVLGVIVFSNNKQATKKFNSKSHENLFEQKYPNRNIDYKLVKSSIIGFSMGSDWKKIESTLHPINGSPYTRGGSTQRRSADEAPLVWIEDLVTGTRQSIESNPQSFDVVITIPHAHDDGVDDGHDTDFLAPLLGDLLFESFDARGIPTIVLKSEVDRDLKDLNRSSSADDDFHKTLDKHLAKAGTLYDIHSYPEYYPVWGDYDIVLFHDGPYHSEADNDTVKDLADYLRSKMDADIFIEVADEEKHFIQNKGLLLEKESFLIEINEKRTDLVSDLAEALADFTAGVKANPPTQLPAGGSYQQFVIALPLTKELDKKRHLMFPNILELELVERGFELRRKTLDPTETFANSMSFGLPDGLPQEPSVQFQRGKGTNFKIYRAQYLSNEELYLIHTLVDESTKNQPILNPWEPKKNIKRKLADMGINESQHEVIWKLIENEKSFDTWNSQQEKKGFKTLTQEQIDELSGFMVPDIDDSSSDKEIEDELKKYNYDIPKKQNKLNRSKALSYFHIVGEFSDDEDIEKELKRRNISIPKKGNKLDREKALEKISTSTTVKQTSVGQFVEAKKQKMNLSTKVTQAVIKALIPGARKLATVSGDPSEKRVITSSSGKKKEMTFDEFVKSRGGNLSDKQKAQWDSSPKVGGGKGKGGRKQRKDDPNEKRLVNGKEMKKGEFVFKYRPKNKSDWAVWDNAAKVNPPVVAVPSDGKFVMDVTDEVVKGVSVRMIDGKPKLSVESTSDNQLDKRFGNIIRINMFRQSAGYRVKGVDEQPKYIISLETGSKHFYVEDMVSIPGLSILRHFPDKKSEPRLRIETRGTITFSREHKTVMVRGKPHKLFKSAKILQMRVNPSYEQQYIDDHIPLDEKNIEKNYKKYKLAGPIGSDAFFEQISSHCQNFGEGQGWVRDGFLYWRKGNNADNYVNVDGLMIEGGEAWMHTHPAAWEPSQTSPDDFIVMHGMFTNHGVKDFFTIIADRIDWFKFRKPVKVNAMVEVIQDFEKDIHDEFNKAEAIFQEKMGDEPYLTSEQTRYITKHFNKNIPEFSATYKAYSLSPQQIISRPKKNPPDTVGIKGFF